MNQIKQPLELLKNYHDKYGCGDAKPEFAFISTLQGYTATCSYKGQITDATCRSKKDAKREAASEMLEALKIPGLSPDAVKIHKSNCFLDVVERQSLVFDKLTESQKSKAASFIEMFQDVNGFKIRSTRKDIDILSDASVGFKGHHGPKSSLLRQCKNNYIDAVDHFQAIMKEMDLKFFCTIPETKQGKNTCVVILSIAFNEITTAGNAASLHEAVYEACKNMISMLLILTE